MDGCLYHTWNKKSSTEEDQAGKFNETLVTTETYDEQLRRDKNNDTN